MHLFLKATGILTRYIGEAPLRIELAENANLKDFLRYIDEHLAHQFPAHLWNREECRFRGPVVIFLDKVVVAEPATRLRNGQKIQIALGFVGG